MLEDLVTRAATGDTAAWQALWSELEPMLSAMIARPRFLGRIGQREQDRRNIVAEVMARLRDDNFQRLQGFVATRALNPSIEVEPWLRVIAKRVAIDCLRAHPDYIDRRREMDANASGKRVGPVTLTISAGAAGAHPPRTNQAVARQLLDDADADHRRALELWSQGASYEDIARELGVADAQKLVRAAVDRLRLKFREA